MPTCPRGHHSTAEDYCDECGVAMAGPAPDTSAGTATPAATGTPCPDCGTPRAGRFCEVCGHDFVTAELGTGAGTAGPAPGTGPPGTGLKPPEVTGDRPKAGLPPDNAAASGAATGAAPAGGGATGGWRVVVVADAAYHERMRAASGPDAQAISFPAFCPERRFVLRGPQMLIGRRSGSRGIEPEIDLTGPPEDPAVSHAHAMLVAQPDGRWAVVDLDSANGTYLNEAADPITAHVPVPLSDGDRIHVGAWTTLAISGGH